jgi:hypothetical protein
MVVVAQLVERWLVEPDVAGSIPVDHPNDVAATGGMSGWNDAADPGTH